MMHDYGWNVFWGGGLLMILFWIGIIVLFLWGLKALLTGERTPQPTRSTPSALEIAQARYARGDISRDEYQALVADLQSTNDTVRYSKEKRSKF